METLKTALKAMKAERKTLDRQISQLEKMIEKFETDTARMVDALNGNGSKPKTSRGRPKGSKNKPKVAAKPPRDGTLRATIISVLDEYEGAVGIDELCEVLTERGIDKSKQAVSGVLTALRKKALVKKGSERGFWQVA